MSDQNTTTVHIVRHGAVNNPDNIYYGREYDFPLSDEGKKQAAAAGQALNARPVAAVFHSPLRRTTQTANILAGNLASPLKPTPSPKLLEVYSPFDGLPRPELEKQNWDLYSNAPAEYEQPADLIDRFHSFLKMVMLKYNGGEIVAVTHGDLVAFAVLWALGKPLTVSAKNDFQNLSFGDPYPATASIFTFILQTPPPQRPNHVYYRNPSRSTQTT